MSDKKEPGKPPVKRKRVIVREPLSPAFIWFIRFAVVLHIYFAYIMYDYVYNYPPLPHVDMDKWWGAHPIDAQPDTSIRPFKIEFDKVMVDDLRDRLLHTRPLVPPLEDAGFTYGFNTDFLKQVLDYWKNKYNFQEREEFFNKYEHFKTKIQGLDLHFMRVKPQVESGVTVLPLLMLHGWPGSFREFYEVIPKLTTPRKGRQFVFEIIAPSLPGFGYSQGTSQMGLGPIEMAGIVHNLMKRIGIEKYYIQGGDLGHLVGSNIATLFPESVLGFHSNTPILLHWSVFFTHTICAFFPSWAAGGSELAPRMYPLSEHFSFKVEESGFLHIQATKPDTIGVALTDSPAGLAAYILEKFSTWTNRANRRARDGNLLDKYSLTHLLDNVMVYWASSCLTTSIRVYKEFLNVRIIRKEIDAIPTMVPVAVLKMRHEVDFQPDWALRLKYHNLLISTAREDGGHFVAMEQPDVLADEVFQAVDRFLEFHSHNNTEAKPTSNSEAKPTSNSEAKPTSNSEAKPTSNSEAKSTSNSEANPTANREAKPNAGNEPKPDANSEAKLNTNSDAKPNWETAKTIFEFTAKDINGREVKLDRYKGHVTLIVNVASYCGFTDTNYKQLNELYEKYGSSKGLRIMAFPCNQFGAQEPGSAQEIFQFAKDRGVKYDLFEKVEVNGENAHPLWKFLKRTQGGTIGDFIKWNFSKFIIDKNGVPVERLAPTVNPLDLEPYLAKYW